MLDRAVWARLNAHEQRVLRGLTTPARIQHFLDHEIGYNTEPDGDTCYSPRLVLKHGVAHCMEGALIAAMALRRIGYPPLLVDMEAVHDSDHVLAVYRVNGHWGAVAQSDYTGLRSREPVYRNLRELAMSYFEDYCNPAHERTLRTYSRPVSLARFDRGVEWMTTLDEVWAIPEYLCGIRHTRLLTKAMERRLNPIDEKLFQANRVGGACEPALDLTRLNPGKRGASTRTASRRPPR